jgi:hypothetical protein
MVTGIEEHRCPAVLRDLLGRGSIVRPSRGGQLEDIDPKLVV